MLTDAALKNLKPKPKGYKVTDRDGMYVYVSLSGTITFRLDYRLNGRRETVNLGRYGRDGVSLLLARERCLDARREVREGRSPAIEKQREKRRLKEAKSFGEFGERWFEKVAGLHHLGVHRCDGQRRLLQVLLAELGRHHDFADSVGPSRRLGRPGPSGREPRKPWPRRRATLRSRTGPCARAYWNSACVSYPSGDAFNYP